MKILVINDNKWIALLLTNTLEKAFNSIDECESIEGSFQKIENKL